MRNEEMSEFQKRLTTVETLVGADEKSGLRGDLNDAHTKIDRVLERLNKLDVRMAVIVGGIIVVSRILEVAFAK